MTVKSVGFGNTTKMVCSGRSSASGSFQAQCFVMKTLRLFLGKAPTGLLSCAAFRRERYCATDVVVGLVGLGNASVEKSVKLGYHQVGVNILNFLLDAEYPTSAF